MPVGGGSMELVADVIVPAYNGSRVIRRAIESALLQKGVGRIIVVDDGSTDDSAAIARSYGPTVTVITQTNRGVGGARNTGVRASTAPLVAFLDQDDVWQRGKLERQIRVFEEQPKVGLVFTDAVVLTLEGTILENGYLRDTPGYVRLSREPLGASAYRLPESIAAALLPGSFIQPSTVVVRRAALEAIGGFDETFRLIDDADCWMRLLGQWRAAAIEETLVDLLVWEQNASLLQRDKLVEERLKLGRKVAAAPALFPLGAAAFFRREESLSLYRLGIVALERGNTTAARQWFVSSFRSRPRFEAGVGLVATYLDGRSRNALLQLKRRLGPKWKIRAD
jgi:glycosyltransferase involved in cell wall biosynthesis